MSADLLRRAAKALREHATEANFVRPDEGWECIETPNAVASESHIAFDGPDAQWAGIADVILGTGAGPYIALVHPPVGLALADWMEAEAEGYEVVLNATNSVKEAVLQIARVESTVQFSYSTIAKAEAVARAILRELVVAP